MHHTGKCHAENILVPRPVQYGGVSVLKWPPKWFWNVLGSFLKKSFWGQNGTKISRFGIPKQPFWGVETRFSLLTDFV